ncbi:GNAT family N-acetyltransferase [Flavobacterium endoglycinae]|uniref:GNAT family N-acetyltransferase n=1 Tax=Flavobacterium endoglycinae TaxID=2816357 RepID=A0ABX7QBC1_9FLAO|nr:GNAT family N-acetyltransferase [Flavobacterium endoglycinae]QSW88340.1 GNAT family N-acetyltransferase [Flavobacterium endoglycinae]
MITTQNLLIRPYKLEDSEYFFKSITNNREYLYDYFANMIKINDSLESAKRYMEQKVIDWKENKNYACGIFLKENNEFIGHISVREIDWRIPKGELAYFIFEKHSGNNYGAEALIAFKNWCFAKKKFNRLFMKIAEENIASIKVAERSGFVYEGLLKKDYRKREENLTDMKIYGYTEDLKLIRTTSQNTDFANLIVKLDENLASRNGDMQEYFNQFNKVDAIKHVIIAYINGVAVGCGAIKQFDSESVEVKRMFVSDEYRGRGVAYTILKELETWAKELHYTSAVLETSNVQTEAVALYTKSAYRVTENYGQYAGIETSICFKKEL